MPEASSSPFNVLIVVLPNFNLAAATGFIDPFRAANYLDGQAHCRWTVASPEGGPVIASNGIRIDTLALSAMQVQTFEMIIVSCSWTPEAYDSPMLRAVLRRGSRLGAVLGGIDTGAFILAKLKHLQGRRATVHDEHLDAFAEMYPDVEVCDDLVVLDGSAAVCRHRSARPSASWRSTWNLRCRYRRFVRPSDCRSAN